MEDPKNQTRLLSYEDPTCDGCNAAGLLRAADTAAVCADHDPKLTGTNCDVCGHPVGDPRSPSYGVCECPTVYLSARFGRIQQMRAVARALTHLRYRVTSRWIAGGHDDAEGGISPVKAAIEDVADLEASDIVVTFTEEPGAGGVGRARGGRHVEFGYALGWGLRCIVVGPRENCFHHMPNVEQVDDVVALVALLVRKPGASIGEALAAAALPAVSR